MRFVTVWKSFNAELNEFVHNHIEDGHVESDFPTARTEFQKKSWSQQRWLKEFAYLTDNCEIVYAK